MVREHTLWVVRLHNGDGQVRLEKRTITLPSGIELHPAADDIETPCPVLPTDPDSATTLLHIYKGDPQAVYSRLFDVFRELAIADVSGATCQRRDVVDAFEQWLQAYTTLAVLNTTALRDAISLPTGRTTGLGPARRFEGVTIHPTTWVIHGAQQEVDTMRPDIERTTILDTVASTSAFRRQPADKGRTGSVRVVPPGVDDPGYRVDVAAAPSLANVAVDVLTQSNSVEKLEILSWSGEDHQEHLLTPTLRSERRRAQLEGQETESELEST